MDEQEQGFNMVLDRCPMGWETRTVYSDWLEQEGRIEEAQLQRLLIKQEWYPYNPNTGYAPGDGPKPEDTTWSWLLVYKGDTYSEFAHKLAKNSSLRPKIWNCLDPIHGSNEPRLDLYTIGNRWWGVCRYKAYSTRREAELALWIAWLRYKHIIPIPKEGEE